MPAPREQNTEKQRKKRRIKWKKMSDETKKVSDEKTDAHGGQASQPAASSKLRAGYKPAPWLKHYWNFWTLKFQRNALIINNVETLKGWNVVSKFVGMWKLILVKVKDGQLLYE